MSLLTGIYVLIGMHHEVDAVVKAGQVEGAVTPPGARAERSLGRGLRYIEKLTPPLGAPLGHSARLAEVRSRS